MGEGRCLDYRDKLASASPYSPLGIPEAGDAMVDTATVATHARKCFLASVPLGRTVIFLVLLPFKIYFQSSVLSIFNSY